MNLADTRTVLWKEWQELGEQLGGGSRTGKLALLVAGVFAAVIMPLQQPGVAWLTSPIAMLFYPFLALSLALQPVVDAFAGERERHTLETLLASRVDDAAIVLGKLLGALLPAWGFGVLLYALANVVVDVVRAGGRPLLPPGWLMLATLAAILLVPALIGIIGVFVSLRAPTVRRAGQTLSLVVMGVMFGPTLLLSVLPERLRAPLEAWARNASPLRVAAAAALALALLDLLLLTIVVARFRRGRLALD